MKIILSVVCLYFVFSSTCVAQESNMNKAAAVFINLLDNDQKAQALFSFESAERYVWNFIPKSDRKGISINEMNGKLKAAALDLLKTGLSENSYQKAVAVMQLEKVLKALENRSEADHYRDTGKYYFTVFGKPSEKEIWGWRLDGHHLSFSFTSDKNKLVSGTPGFFGANPAVVLGGPQKGLEIFKQENELAFELLNLLSKDQLDKTMINTMAPAEIITGSSRTAIIENPAGISYGDMTGEQQKIFMQLLSVYIRRYTRLFEESMMNGIEAAGMSKLFFAWAGSKENGPGNKRYYRIQGPTIIIEYDNTQNNGNHVHTVIRDLKTDFGGDELLQHYKKSHGKE